MATKISALPAASSVAKLDEFPANSAGAAPTKKITMSGIADFLHSNYYTNLDSTYSVAGSYGETYKTYIL